MIDILKNAKRITVQVRVTDNEKALFTQMAEKEGLTLSQFIRRACYKDSYEIMKNTKEQ